MNQKKIIVHDEPERDGDEKKAPEKKKPCKRPKPPEKSGEEQEEDIDVETRRPKMRW